MKHIIDLFFIIERKYLGKKRKERHKNKIEEEA